MLYTTIVIIITIAIIAWLIRQKYKLYLTQRFKKESFCLQKCYTFSIDISENIEEKDTLNSYA